MERLNEGKVAEDTGYKRQKRGRGKSEVAATRLFAEPHVVCGLGRCEGGRRVVAALCSLSLREGQLKQ
jgi:hypothetical protein